jgi:A/G-specific adenine glycosylase
MGADWLIIKPAKSINSMPTLATKLLVWFDDHGRTHLPWQQGAKNRANVYHVWLSEIMLQQTQVATVIDYFKRFIQHFPTLKSLANADDDAVLAQWAGLGYYARARNLHKTAQIIERDYQGKFPQDFEQVLALPGIGKSTAGAILSLSFNQTHAILDGNVKRVLARIYQVQGHFTQRETLKELWRLSAQHTPKTRTDAYTQAIMDLGATLCVRKNPHCERCPLGDICLSNIHQTQAQFPQPKPKKAKPSRTIAMLIFINPNNQIYLQKRPNKGIWGGLWSFLECEDTPQATNQAVLAFDKTATIKQKLPVFRHTFTHYHLHIRPIIINCASNKAGFHALQRLTLGVPKPVMDIIKTLTSDNSQVLLD